MADLVRHAPWGRPLATGILPLLLWALPATVQGQYTYITNNDETLTIGNYRGPGGAVTIPSLIDGRLVTAIGEGAFYRTCLTRVTIPSSVTNDRQ